jgi:hypothetical protein
MILLSRKTQWLLRNVEQMFVFDYLKSNQNPPNGDEHSLVLREARYNIFETVSQKHIRQYLSLVIEC